MGILLSKTNIIINNGHSQEKSSQETEESGLQEIEELETSVKNSEIAAIPTSYQASSQGQGSANQKKKTAISR